MSGTIPSVPATGPLTNAERVQTRRFCGYPVYGPGASGFIGDRFFTAYGTLEYRLSNLADDELAQVRVYLGQIAGLELAILTSTSQIDIGSAPAFQRNPQAMNERRRIFADWRGMLCGFLGVPPGPQMPGAQGGRILM